MTIITEERLAIVEAVRDFASTVLAPNAAEWDASKHFPVDALAQAGELGLGGIYVQEDVGGSGLSRGDAVAIFEELAKGDTTIAAYISIHNMVAWMIDTFGNDVQRHTWVPGMVAMTDLGSYCLTEPGAGSDAAAITTSAVRDGDDYVINGVKQFISGAGSSAVYVVMARTGGPGSGSRGISAIVVPAGTPGLSFGPNEHKMGWNAQPTRQVIFDNVRVPVGNRLGAEGDGFGIAMKGLNGGRVNMGACSLGGAQWALERALQYVQERHAFGQPLAANQSIVFTLADMETELQAARALLQRAAEKMDENAPDVAPACALAKRYATDAAFGAANAALQLHGGYGYLHEYGIERVVRDLRVHQILEGTNEIMKLIVGRDLLASAR
ncbi:acyl-CoA dehydrogenase family protein [Agromyces aerolatus]|uniref:acyl-CoA dehydrogenase family protein n=1 Tax=Agromyces sp. LY-1074 TaxID=3074080 RepID=UPI0028650D20|nr:MULTISPECIES: acyl-CoA dehydrogenase family protein [unclassified Agromyces]MDR5701620.1 acyl-CoA dehydrogenase family protein [Agromyces sp. LY-1074]MDR5706150.1 acyl-CoA dehydrogenase family protein [Agromyces sp. LY-1358]